MDWTHIYIAGAAMLVFALVGLVLLVSSQHIKVANTSVGPYLRFIWASFIKPHDKKVGGQQGALESFYKTQVRLNPRQVEHGFKLTILGCHL
jgi:betaine lipid synthase